MYESDTGKQTGRSRIDLLLVFHCPLLVEVTADTDSIQWSKHGHGNGHGQIK